MQFHVMSAIFQDNLTFVTPLFEQEAQLSLG